ncbi:MAG TPA: DinB family protein [Dehalococcoidia bacterium]|nr:DinB family protein [Dehalococcoidia bacterium]
MNEAIQALIDVRSRLLAACDLVPPEHHTEPFIGAWDLHDLLAHLAGWDYIDVAAIADLVAGRRPAFYDDYDADWAKINARLVQTYRQERWLDAVDAARMSQELLVAALTALPDGELDRDRGVRWNGHQLTIARILRATVRDEAAHVHQIEAFALTRR